MPNQSWRISLVINWQGQCRQAVLRRPTIHGEMFALSTTLHAGRGMQLIPAAAPRALIPEAGAGADLGYGRVTPGMPAYDGDRHQLGRVVEAGYAVLSG